MIPVSVCLPTYNSGSFIGNAIESVLSQTFTDFELVISDDNSVDGTQEFIQQVRDPRVRPFANGRRIGLVANWNRCLQLAEGEYVTMFGHDDVMLPDHLARSVCMLEAHPHLGFVFSNVEYIDEAGQIIAGHWTSSELPIEDKVWAGDKFFQTVLRVGNLVTAPTVLMRREWIARLGGFDPRLTYTLDFEMWLRLALHADVGYIAEPLVHLRRHHGQATTRFVSHGGDVEQVWRALQIVFTEQRQYIQQPSAMFNVGLSHLVWWSRMQAWWALRELRIRAAATYAMLFIRFAYIRQWGLAALVPLPAQEWLGRYGA